MDRNKFDLLSNEDKINYINEELLKGKTVIRIREDLNIGEKSLQRIIKDSGYKYNQKLKRYDKQHTEIIQTKEYDKDNTNIIPYNIKDDLIEIVQMKDDLKELIKNYKEGYDKEHTQVIEVIADEGIRINLSNSEVVRTTVRVNKDVLDKWNSFCDKHKEFSKTNLLSSCMLEYIDKYDKN